MAKKVWLFFLVISVSYASGFLSKASFHPKATLAAETSSDNMEGNNDTDDTDFC